MKTMKWFLFLAAFFPIAPTGTEVVNSVSDCSEFLLKETPPRIPGIIENGNIQNQNRYKVICQTYNDERRYLTLYDTHNRIPVFSAYKFQRITSKGRPETPWMIEPQLSRHTDENMMPSEDVFYDKQASNKDYLQSVNKNKHYNRGHLYPCCHAPKEDDKKSTFTLTNIVPQAVSFNGGSWTKMEGLIKSVMEEFCINNNGVIEGFVVVGAQPSVDNKLNKRVNIPDMLWSAFCCYSSTKKKWLAGAHWGANIADSKGRRLPTKTVEELNKKLSTEDSRFDIFPGQQQCLRSKFPSDKVSQAVGEECECPPTLPDTDDTSATTNLESTDCIPDTAEPNLPEQQTWNIVPKPLRCAWRYAAECTQACKETLQRCMRNARQCVTNFVNACAQKCRCVIGTRA